MTASPLELGSAVELGALGALAPVSRSGGQGRVYAAAHPPAWLGPSLVVKLYRARQPPSATATLEQMVAWSRALAGEQFELLHQLTAWPLATVAAGGELRGIVMADVRPRFQVPFTMPSGRTAPVLLQLEHLLGPDHYLRQRGLPTPLDTRTRAHVAERISAAFAFLHRHAIAVSDVSPSNLLIAFSSSGPEVCLIDCDSMIFRGRAALAAVQTGDWQLPAAFAGESSLTRAADAYKLGLIVLRLFARSHDARALAPHERHVPAQLRALLARALCADAPNRPSAGEWQLALARTLEDGGLLTRYPGPSRPLAPPRPPARPRPAITEPRPRAPLAAARAPLAAAAPRAASARSTEGGEYGLLPAFTLAWLIAGVLLLLLFAHLLAGAVQPTSIGRLGAERAPAVERALTPSAGYPYRGGEEQSFERAESSR